MSSLNYVIVKGILTSSFTLRRCSFNPFNHPTLDLKSILEKAYSLRLIISLITLMKLNSIKLLINLRFP